jgi:hypothetical protein
MPNTWKRLKWSQVHPLRYRSNHLDRILFTLDLRCRSTDGSKDLKPILASKVSPHLSPAYSRSLAGFPLDKYAISQIFFSEMISTVGHLREERALFTPEYFQQKKIPRVLSNILSEEIQKLGRSEATPQDQDQATVTAQVFLLLSPLLSLTYSCRFLYLLLPPQILHQNMKQQQQCSIILQRILSAEMWYKEE